MLSRLLSALVACALLIAAGCASAPQLDETIPEVSAQDQLQSYRAIVRALREHPYHELVQQELDRVDGWMIEVSQRLAQDEVDGPRVALLMEVIQAQLVETRARLASLEAERALEAEREAYERQMQQIQQQREQNAARLSGDVKPQEQQR